MMHGLRTNLRFVCTIDHVGYSTSFRIMSPVRFVHLILRSSILNPLPLAVHTVPLSIIDENDGRRYEAPNISFNLTQHWKDLMN
jgi:hypothetical protein